MFLNEDDIENIRNLVSKANCSIKPPGAFNFLPQGLIRKWKKWKRKFRMYRDALEKCLNHDCDESFRVSLLIYLLGENAEEIFKWLEWKGWTPYQTLDETIHRLGTHFIRMANTQNNVYRRLYFHRRFQLAGESITEYIKAIKFLAELCNFEISYNMMLRDKMVIGIISDSAREKMFELDDMLTFEKACMIAYNDELRKARRPG